MKFVVGAILCGFLSVTSGEKQLPSFVEPCYRDDPQLSECITRNINILQPKLGKGIPELGLPPLSPFKTLEVTIEADKSLRIDLYKADLYHLDTFKIKHNNFDLKNKRWSITLDFESLGLEADYKMKGKLLFLELDNTGRAFGNLTQITAKVDMYYQIITKKTKEYLVETKRELKLNIGKYNVKFDKLLGENKELNQRTNEIINENYKILLEEFTPALENVVNAALSFFDKNIFRKFPFDVLFPKNA